MYPLFRIFFIQTLQQKQGTLWHCVNIQMFSLSPNGMDEIHVLQCFGFFISRVQRDIHIHVNNVA